MYDIVFDFSSSPTGGALRRLEAYIHFFSKSELKVIFLINKKAISIFEKYKVIEFECVNKSIFEKLFGKNKYLDIILKFQRSIQANANLFWGLVTQILIIAGSLYWIFAN